MNHFMSSKDQSNNLFQGYYPEPEPIYPSSRAVLNNNNPLRSDMDRQDPKEDEYLLKLLNQQHQQHEGKTTKGRQTFPLKLHKMLEDSENENNQDIIGWEPDGLSFKIHKPEEFIKIFLQRYFNHSNFRSFQRQLYHYHFRKINFGSSHGAYFHPQFLKHDKSQFPTFGKKKTSSNPDEGNQITDRAKQIRNQILPTQRRRRVAQLSNKDQITDRAKEIRDQILPTQFRVARLSASSSEEDTEIEMPFNLNDTRLLTNSSTGRFKTTNDDDSRFKSICQDDIMADNDKLQMDDTIEPLPLGVRGDLTSPEMKDLLLGLFFS